MNTPAVKALGGSVWAALLLISAGLGPLAGTLALALHTAGVLGRLFAEAVENAPPGPADARTSSRLTGAKADAAARGGGPPTSSSSTSK